MRHMITSQEERERSEEVRATRERVRERQPSGEGEHERVSERVSE